MNLNRNNIPISDTKADLRNSIWQLAIYLVVGGIATIVEWAAFYLLNTTMGIYYMLATTLAFVVSTFANWAAGRLLLFRGVKTSWKELAQIYLTSTAGLLMNLLIMWIAIEKIGISNNISKVIATGIVFIWNFAIRKIFIYKI